MTSETSITLRSGGEIKTATTPSKETRELSLYAGQIVPFLGTQYSFFILDSKTSKVSTDPTLVGLNPADAKSPPEYFFEVPPRVQEISEPFSTSIVPTQRGGKYVESHGSIIKDIMIRGTTGLRPRKHRGPASGIPLIGQAVDNLTQQFQLGTGVRANIAARRGRPEEQTGYDDIIFMRNIFRAYSDFKENNKASNHILMIWRNNRDDDSWIVEPKEFKINRTSSSPLTYEYQITLQTLAPITVAFHKPTDPLSAVLATRKVFSRVAEFQHSLRRSFLVVSTQIRRLEGLGVYAQTQLITPLINVTNGLGVIRYTGSTFGRRLKHNAEVLRDELDKAIDLLAGTPGVEPQDALVRSLRRARITCARILVEPGVRETIGGEGGNRRERFSRSYTTGGDFTNDALKAPVTGGSSTFIGNSRTSDKVAQGVVYAGEDIRSIAGRLLNNRSSWHILVSLNDLTAPYITHNGVGDTLKPGDLILYPTLDEGFAASGINVVSPKEAESKDTVPDLHQAYGRDLRLKSAEVGGTDLADLYINQRGDFSTVVGIPNVGQAITVKLSTEQGELPVHPSFGASFPVGNKATPFAVSDFRIQTESTLYSDGRVRKINTLNFETNGDVLLLQANLTLTDKSDGLNVAIPIRRL